MRISDINLKVMADSRGEDTLEAEAASGNFGAVASVPSGKSKGSNEVFVLEPQKALLKFALIKPQILGQDFASLAEFDNFLISLDGTKTKQNLGGNLILVLSIVFSKLLAKVSNMEVYQLIARQSGRKLEKFPLLFFNLVEGGVHAKNSLPFQEYLFIPQTYSPAESLAKVLPVIKHLGEKIHSRYKELKQGDEGGYMIPSFDPKEGLQVLQEEISKGACLGLDVAASAFFADGLYHVGTKMSRQQLLELYQKIAADFDLFSIEDPFDEEDWEGFVSLNQGIGQKVWIVGDDLTTTNVARIKLARQKNAVNTVVIKPNQIGTVTETIKATLLAQSYGWKIIVSHRSGETGDTFIADLAYGLGADGFKAGCPLKEERLVKYQRLAEIEKQLKL